MATAILRRTPAANEKSSSQNIVITQFSPVIVPISKSELLCYSLYRDIVIKKKVIFRKLRRESNLIEVLILREVTRIYRFE